MGSGFEFNTDVALSKIKDKKFWVEFRGFVVS
jgi:hypothetical protein